MNEVSLKSYSAQILFREYFEGILAAIFLALFLRFFVLSVLFIPVDTMSPTLLRGDYVLGWRLSYGLPLPLTKGERLLAAKPQHGDVVSLRFPGDEEQTLVRRVVGVAGDKIEIRAGLLFLNGKQLTQIQEEGAAVEAYPSGLQAQISISSQQNFGPMRVPRDQVFVLSDRREMSDDSRDWGAVPVQNIESRLKWIWLSLDRSDGELSLRTKRIFKTIR